MLADIGRIFPLIAPQKWFWSNFVLAHLSRKIYAEAQSSQAASTTDTAARTAMVLAQG